MSRLELIVLPLYAPCLVPDFLLELIGIIIQLMDGFSRDVPELYYVVLIIWLLRLDLLCE